MNKTPKNDQQEYPWWSIDEDPGHPEQDPVILRALGDIAGLRILDLGCGNGTMAIAMARLGATVVGCDGSHSAIDQALLQEQSSLCKFRHVSVHDGPEQLNEEPFDIVVCQEVIEHLYYPADVGKFSEKILKPEGRLIITTPYYGRVRCALIGLTGRWDHHHCVWFDHGHIKFFSPRTLEKVIARTGFERTHFSGIGGLPFLWRTMLMEFRRSTEKSKALS